MQFDPDDLISLIGQRKVIAILIISAIILVSSFIIRGKSCICTAIRIGIELFDRHLSDIDDAVICRICVHFAHGGLRQWKQAGEIALRPIQRAQFHRRLQGDRHRFPKEAHGYVIAFFVKSVKQASIFFLVDRIAHRLAFFYICLIITLR